MLRYLRSVLLTLPLLVLAPAVCDAQERSPADTARAQAEAAETRHPMDQMQQMMPMMTQMMRQVTQSSMEALADPETARNLARFTRNYYEALVAQGFTEEQALRIVANLGFPPAPSL